MDDCEFDWEVLEIINDLKKGRRGAVVRYTPCGELEECTPIEQFVAIPWHKATNQEHARELMERKIRSYVPSTKWARELNPPPPDRSEAILDGIGTEHRGEHRTETGTERSASADHVPEPDADPGQ